MGNSDGGISMITFDFDYYRPSTFQEATDTYEKLTRQGKTVIYYAGGTEIISRSRLNRMSYDAVIDIKAIPECNVLEFQGNQLVMGATVTLTSLCKANYFPLLSATCRRTADHTARDMITLGGNICGKTPYREAVLPLLLCDSDITVAGINGVRSLPLTQAFNSTLQLEEGEFLVQISLNQSYTSLPYSNIKKTKQESVDYPLVTLSSILMDGKIRLAFSGLCPFPFRSSAIEEYLNDVSVPLDTRIESALGLLPAPVLADALGSASYRSLVFKNALVETIEQLGGMV